MDARENTSPGESARRRGIDSVEIAGTILQAALRLDAAFRLKDLEKATGIPSPTLYRYLVSLTQCGLLQRVEGGSRYTLGLLAFQLGQRASQGNDLVSLVAPHAQEFSQRIGETCAIGLWFDQGPAIVKWFEVNRAISISLRLGAELPLTASSTARVLAAFLPREVTEPVLLREVEAGGLPASQVEATFGELEEIRRLGIAQGVGSHIRGISSLSAPVFGHDGRLVLALSAIGNQMTFDASLDGSIAKELKALAARLSGYLGSPPAGDSAGEKKA
jgi:DNA-binding IclR family transcriptional regulator